MRNNFDHFCPTTGGIRTIHDNTARSKDTTLEMDRMGSENAVAGTYPDGDASPPLQPRERRTRQDHQSQQCHVARDLFEWDLVKGKECND